MTKPTTLRPTKLSIWVGDGNSPEDFTSKSCALTTRSITITGETADSVVPDCDDPDLPAWIERFIRSLSSQIVGSGLIAEETLQFWITWALSGEAKNIRFVLDGVTLDGYFEGSYLLTQAEFAGNDNEGKAALNLTFSNDGPVTFETGAP